MEKLIVISIWIYIILSIVIWSSIIDSYQNNKKRNRKRIIFTILFPIVPICFFGLIYIWYIFIEFLYRLEK